MSLMNKILSPLKYLQARKLQNTQWRCDTQIEEIAEYYQLNFVSSCKVEGFSKTFLETEPQHMFTANFTLEDKTTIQFFNQSESFTGLLSSTILMATIEGEMLLFRKC